MKVDLSKSNKWKIYVYSWSEISQVVSSVVEYKQKCIGVCYLF